MSLPRPPEPVLSSLEAALHHAETALLVQPGAGDPRRGDPLRANGAAGLGRTQHSRDLMAAIARQMERNLRAEPHFTLERVAVKRDMLLRYCRRN